jgi:hypothetical protein
MTQATTHEYTAEDVTQAFEEITATLFTGKTAESTPKLLITAGLQGSGKTYLLEKKLLPSGLYGNYIRLYLPEYREKHPQYAEMIKLGVLYAYEHTEAFVREVSGKIHAEAFKRKFNIVMECAFDSIDFASLPPLAQKEGYQFEIHIVGCNQAFAHVSSIKRGLKSLENKELERFVRLETLETSMSNAQAILLAFEAAAKAAGDSQIYLYERGLGHLKERKLLAQSTYTRASDDKLTVTSLATPYTYDVYRAIINRSVYAVSDRDEMIKVCHLALLKSGNYADQVPDAVYNDLYAYIVKYVYR